MGQMRDLFQIENRELSGYLSPREVAEQLGVSKRTVYRRIRASCLPAYRLTGVGPNPPLRIAESDLASWLAGSEPQRERVA
jgi:excisionase family DNA binding protein